MLKLEDITVKITLAKEGHEEEWLQGAKFEYADMMVSLVTDKKASKEKALLKLEGQDVLSASDADKIASLKVEIEELKEVLKAAQALRDEYQEKHDEFIAKTGDTVRNLLRLSVAYSNRNLLGYVLPKTATGSAFDLFVALVNIHSFAKAGEEGQNLSTQEEYARARGELVKFYRPFFDFTAESEFVEKVRIKKVAKADQIKGVDGSFMFALHEQFIRGARTTVKGGTKLNMTIKPVKDKSTGIVSGFDMSKFNSIVCDLMYRVIF